MNQHHEKTQDAESPAQQLLFLIKIAVAAFSVGFCLHLGEYTAEQIWPTPSITITVQE